MEWNEIPTQSLIELLVPSSDLWWCCGLTNGLGGSVSAQIDNYGSLHCILSTDSEGLSFFNREKIWWINKIEKGWAILLSIQRGANRLKKPTPWISPISRPIITKRDPQSNHGRYWHQISDLKRSQIILDHSFKGWGESQIGDQW